MTKIPCGYCQGTGELELSTVYAETLEALKAAVRSTGADLAKTMGCKATAANMRLKMLEKHGLATAERDGRKVYYMLVWEHRRGPVKRSRR